MSKHNGYDLSRSWFDFAFENPDLINPNDHALYYWLVEKNNRCGWVEKFSCTASESMAACGFKTYPPYKKSFDKLVDLGFVEIVVRSKNQYQCNVIALSKNNKPLAKALDKALLRQTIKHVESNRESNRESTFNINKPQTEKQETKKPKTKKQSSSSEDDVTPKEYLEVYNKFLQKRTGASEQFSIAGRAALKKIYLYLRQQVKNTHPEMDGAELEDQSVKAWEYVLHNFDKWDNFHKGQLKIEQINSNLINIINSIKNGNPKNSRQQIDPVQLATEAINLSRESAQRRANGDGYVPQG